MKSTPSDSDAVIDEMERLLVTKERLEAFQRRFKGFDDCFFIDCRPANGTANLVGCLQPREELLEFLAALGTPQRDSDDLSNRQTHIVKS